MVESVVQTGVEKKDEEKKKKKKKNGSPLTKTPFGERLEKNLTPSAIKFQTIMASPWSKQLMDHCHAGRKSDY